MSPPSLSALICVKDEQLLLARTLRSIRPIADEIIVVDTGSTDQTVPIARSEGAKVLSGPTGENFLQAWNFGLEASRGDWVLNLDGDEVIAASDLAELKRLLYASADAYIFPVRNYTCLMDLMWNWHPNNGDYPAEEALSGCPGGWKSQALRLFRRLPGVSFRQGQTNHTRPDESIRQLKLKVANSQVVLHNLGWLKGGDSYLARKNADRLKGELAHTQKQASDHVNIARTYLFLEQDECALEHLELALAIDPRYVDAHYIRGLVGKESGRLELAEDALLRALALQEDHADAWTVLGMVYEMQGKPEIAHGALKRALHFRPDHPLAHNSLGIVFECLGHKREAEASYRRALEIHPQLSYATENLASLLEGEPDT